MTPGDKALPSPLVATAREAEREMWSLQIFHRVLFMEMNDIIENEQGAELFAPKPMTDLIRFLSRFTPHRNFDRVRETIARYAGRENLLRMEEMEKARQFVQLAEKISQDLWFLNQGRVSLTEKGYAACSSSSLYFETLKYD